MRAPNWIVSAIIVIALSAFFVLAYLQPLFQFWNLLEGLKPFIIGGALFFAFVGVLFVLSSENEDELIRNIAILGGGLVWIRVAYLGLFGLLFGLIAAVLIYYLSKIVLEEE